MFTRAGHSPISFPRIIGIECIGVVAGYPSTTTSQPFPVGSRVATCMGGLGRQIPGSYAEYTCVAQENIRLIPATRNLSVAQLAALPEMFKPPGARSPPDLMSRKARAFSSAARPAPSAYVPYSSYES